MSSFTLSNNPLSGFIAPILRYERHLSALAMLAGFGIDNYAFGRIDRPGAHLIFAAYLTLAAISIAAAHWLQTRADKREAELARRRAILAPRLAAQAQRSAKAAALTADSAPALAASESGHVAKAEKAERKERWRKLLPAATQFALGGLWSGFLVFYWRSASFTASWLFLVTLAAFFIGNEIFRHYHSRLVFAVLLFFFALYSYAVFTVPVVTGTIGKITFIISGIVAIAVFYYFTRLLSWLGRARYAQSRWKLLGGAAAITVAMNLFYFNGVLPPLPLALTKIGVFHSVKHVGAIYQAQTEPEPWYTSYGFGKSIVHVGPKDSLSLYSAVFAPVKLSTRITDRWERYDPVRRRWVNQSVVSFSINGGRDGGYRNYTIKSAPKPGDWRADIVSADGRLIGRTWFTVVAATVPVPTTTVTLN